MTSVNRIMHDKEKKVWSERLAEATKKGFTGMEGKFGTILKYLGHPIIGEGGSFYETYENVDPYAPIGEEEEEDMPTMDEDQSIMELGYIFDGLSSGLHLEIKYIADRQDLTVTYKGFTVYSEVAGELVAYAPRPEWENVIEALYIQAKKRENKHRGEFMIENRQEAQRQKESLLERLRLRWGL